MHAGRLATLTRTEPLPPDATAFLACWAAAAPDGAARTAFCVAAMQELWFASDGPVSEVPYAALWREHVGGEPSPGDEQAVHRAERQMRRRRLYDTPAAVVHGQWFFAHERLPSIGHRLDELGWRVGT